MSDQTIAALKATRLGFLKTLQPIIVDKPEETGEKSIGTLAQELPPPATQEDVDAQRDRYEADGAILESGRRKLENPADIQPEVDWEIGLFVLLAAWIVNYGHDPEAEEARKAAQAGDIQKALLLAEQATHFVYEAARIIGLEWIPFVDLALVSQSPTIKASGPYAGVFVSRGANPFLIFAFKGTTYDQEVQTDLRALFVAPRDGFVYGEKVHQGMAEGLFKLFPEQTETAFDLCYKGIEKVASDLQKESGGNRKIPVYVTGHSLGAGYADIAYVELIRRYDASPSSYWTLNDLWVYGGPRVGLNSLAVRVKELLATSGRHLFRPTNYRDLVPTLPTLVLVSGEGLKYAKHFDGGYKLNPDEPPYVTPRASEIDTTQLDNDPNAEWTWHWPTVYYENIKKVVENENA